MITADGTPKILDFGLASITRMSEETEFVTRPNAGISGTPAYLTPEQLLGKPADHRSDQFALGTVLYQCVKGVNPFLRETAPSTFAAILESSPPQGIPGQKVSPQSSIAALRRTRHGVTSKRQNSLPN